MNEAQVIWRVNIAEALDLFETGFDDLCADPEGRVYVGDGVNASVHRIAPQGEIERTFDVINPAPIQGQESGLSLLVTADSSFSVADPGNGRVVRYDPMGRETGEFAAPGLLAFCGGPDDTVYVLSSSGDEEKLDCYDAIGCPLDTLCAPKRHRSHLAPELVSVDVDTVGSAYVSYGMPPYRVWRISRTAEVAEVGDRCAGTSLDTWQRDFDHPEDAVLISDICFDPASSILWVLLAFRQSGRQALDAFSPQGDFLGSVGLPRIENLFSGVCASGDGGLYALDGAAGDLVRIGPPVGLLQADVQKAGNP